MTADSTRRTFLQTAGLGLAGMSLSAARPAADHRDAVDRRQGIELCIATICLDGFGDEKYEHAFRLIPQIGVTNVDFNMWYPGVVTPGAIRSIQERCFEHGLKPICLQGQAFGGNPSKDVGHKLWLMEQARYLGCRRVKFTGARRGADGGLETVIEVLKELAPAADDMDVLVLVENHKDNNIETLEDYDRIFEAVDSPHVGMCLDPGHFVGASIRCEDVIERFHERVLHIDLKDTEAFGTYKTVNYGSGAVDLHAMVESMIAHGYTGYLEMEQAPPLNPETLVEDLKRGYEMFKPYER